MFRKKYTDLFVFKLSLSFNPPEKQLFTLILHFDQSQLFVLYEIPVDKWQLYTRSFRSFLLGEIYTARWRVREVISKRECSIICGSILDLERSNSIYVKTADAYQWCKMGETMSEKDGIYTTKGNIASV